MNPHILRIEPSLIRSINARKRSGDIDFGLGEPTLRPDLEPFEAALEWTRVNGSPYSPNAGFHELRRLVAEYLDASSWRSGPLGEQQVCITVGSEEALYLAIKTLADAALDEVLVVEPCYLAYPKICILEGIRYRMVSLDGAEGFRPDAATVLEAIRPETRLIVINSPSNPTGRIWPAEELKALSAGLERLGRGDDIFVLSDEVYRELYFGDEPPPSIATYCRTALVAGSLSKSNALTGLRLGWLAGPPDVIEQAVKVHQFVNTAASTFSQRVAIEIFSGTGNVGRHREVYRTARETLVSAAKGARLTWLPPEGAFYALVRLPDTLATDSVAAAERLLEEKRVVTVPGRAFGGSAEGWLRLSWVAPGEVIEEGLLRLGEWLEGESMRVASRSGNSVR